MIAFFFSFFYISILAATASISRSYLLKAIIVISLLLFFNEKKTNAVYADMAVREVPVTESQMAPKENVRSHVC